MNNKRDEVIERMDETSDVNKAKDWDEDDKVYRKGAKKFWLGMVLGVVWFGCLFLAAMMQGKQASTIVNISMTFGIIGIFVFGIFSLYFVIKYYADVMIWEHIKKEKKYDKQQLVVVQQMSRENVEAKLLQHQFQYIEEGYYLKKKFYLLKDTIRYYVRVKNSSSSQLRDNIEQEIDCFDEKREQGKQGCLLLIYYMNRVGEKEKAIVKDISSTTFLKESMFMYNQQIKTNVIVMVIDRETSKGYFLDTSKESKLSIYSYGCRMLNELFK